MQSPSSQCSRKKLVNGGLCVVRGFVQGGVVVINCINGDLGEPVFKRVNTFLNCPVIVSSLIFHSLSSRNLYATIVTSVTLD